MKAIVYRSYGSADVLRCEDVDEPQPGDDDALIRVRAASVNPRDRHLMHGKPRLMRLGTGLSRPRHTRFGADFAGEVAAVGRNVTKWRPGDAVFGSCMSALAEYTSVPAASLAAKPPNMSFEQAASVPVAGYSALQALRDGGRLQTGQSVLINGASGGVGTFAVQIAKALGAHVAGVCSTRNVDLVRSIGAEQVIDYTREDFTARSERYDVFIDNMSNHSLLACRRVLTPRGRYVMVGGPTGGWINPLPRALAALVVSSFASQKLSMFLARPSVKDLEGLGTLMADGRLVPVIDRRYSLSEVPAAIRYLEEGHVRGKVVITV